MELLTRQLFSRFSWPHLQTCYFWRERHHATAPAFPRKNARPCLACVDQEGKGRHFSLVACKDLGPGSPPSRDLPELGEEEEEEKENKGTRVALPLKMAPSICTFPACFQRRIHEITGRGNTCRLDITTTHTWPTHVHFQACGRISSPRPLGTGMAT